MMIHDIAPYKFNVAYVNCRPEENDFIILMRGGAILVRTDEDSIEFPVWADAKSILDIDIESCDARYLFEIEGAGRFFFVWQGMSDDIIEILINNGYELMTQRNVQFHKPRWAAFAGTTACHFARWYEENRFCGKCGGPMTFDDVERMVYCEKCKIPVYPRINPVVIVGICDGDRILLVKYAGGEYHKYCLVAGFMEAGESVEDAVKREVFEETGIHVKNIRYYKSQPWAMSGSMILGVYCDLDGSDQVSLNDGELAVAEWFNREDVPYGDEGISVTAELMNGFIEGKEK
ncbi:MAG: NAD(+) diphosphatase [Bacillota bacterium]|nr:NAD(+) diphosphatase [Bacillota bacterium]